MTFLSLNDWSEFATALSVVLPPVLHNVHIPHPANPQMPSFYGRSKALKQSAAAAAAVSPSSVGHPAEGEEGKEGFPFVPVEMRPAAVGRRQTVSGIFRPELF